MLVRRARKSRSLRKRPPPPSQKCHPARPHPPSPSLPVELERRKQGRGWEVPRHLFTTLGSSYCKPTVGLISSVEEGTFDGAFAAADLAVVAHPDGVVAALADAEPEGAPLVLVAAAVGPAVEVARHRVRHAPLPTRCNSDPHQPCLGGTGGGGRGPAATRERRRRRGKRTPVRQKSWPQPPIRKLILPGSSSLDPAIPHRLQLPQYSPPFVSWQSAIGRKQGKHSACREWGARVRQWGNRCFPPPPAPPPIFAPTSAHFGRKRDELDQSDASASRAS